MAKTKTLVVPEKNY